MSTDADVDIDDIDRQLLDALIDDGRASARDLAATVGIATATATKRLRHLEEAGVIDGYRAEIDFGALGLDVTAVFQVQLEGDGHEAVVDALAADERTIAVYEVTGDNDVVAIAKFESTDGMTERYQELLGRPAVRSVATAIAVDVACEHDPLPVADDAE